MDSEQSLLLKKYIDLLFRWKTFLIVVLLLSLPAGLGVYLIKPKVYQADSLLSYQQQRVNPNTMSPDVESRIEDIVSTLSQIVTSRTNMEYLITTLNLYEELRKTLPLEDVMDVMRKDIGITPSRDGDTFIISYRGSNPEKVVKVTNALAAKFIEENLKYREERATETSSYTSNELEMAKETMDRKEAAMRDYKLKFYNEMPDQQQSNVSRLIALQEQYQGRQESILELERTRVMIREQIGVREQLLASEAEATRAALAQAALQPGAAGGGTSGGQEDAASRLLRLRAQLDALLVKYTANHPDVKQMKRTIAQLEAELASEGGGSVATAGSGQRTSRRASLQDEEILQLQTQSNDIERAIKAIEKEKDQLRDEVKRYEGYVASAPVREAEWAALTREYGELKRHYDYLVAQDLQAKSMLNLERRQKGSQFKIEDPARMPETPVEPDFKKIMVFTVGGAMAAALGLIMLVGFIDGSFRDPEDLEKYIGMPVVSTLTYFQTKRERRFQLVKSTIAVICVCVLVLLVAAVFWYAWSKGLIVI